MIFFNPFLYLWDKIIRTGGPIRSTLNKGTMELDNFIEQINGKSPKVFHDLFQDYYKTLVHYSMQYVKVLEDAEDIVQDLFVRLWENDAKYESLNSLQTYLYTSARNASLDFLKHKEVEKRYADHAMRQDEADEDPDMKVLEEELYRTLWQHVEELPQRRKEIFKLYLEGKTEREIGELLGVSAETVKIAKKESVRYIRQRMGKLFALLCLLDGGKFFAGW